MAGSWFTNMDVKCVIDLDVNAQEKCKRFLQVDSNHFYIIYVIIRVIFWLGEFTVKQYSLK